jgi:hypothetical protein
VREGTSGSPLFLATLVLDFQEAPYYLGSCRSTLLGDEAFNDFDDQRMARRETVVDRDLNLLSGSSLRKQAAQASEPKCGSKLARLLKPEELGSSEAGRARKAPRLLLFEGTHRRLQAGGSAATAAVSKTVIRGFESLPACCKNTR